MDYGTFRPEGGYNARAAPAARSARLKAAEAAGLAKREGTFKELLVTEGVGPYHLNHFIIYGSYMPAKSAEVTKLGDRFFRDFVDVFDPNKVARAEKGKYKHKGDATIEFEIGGEDFDALQFFGGLLHSDWVSIQKGDDGESFYGSTLRRQWLLPSEDGALAATRFILKWTQDELLDFIRVNQHHFLAGRRSWRLGYDSGLKSPYVETAAFERSSLCEYSGAERIGLFRESIIEIWTSLLTNVRKDFTSIKWISPESLPDQSVRAGYETVDDVDYRTASFETAEEALDEQWFAKIFTRHPGLLKGL